MSNAVPSANADNELLYRIENGIGVVTFNRPQQRNALTFGMYERLGQICRDTKLGDPVKVIVVTGAGDKAFAAGTDIAQFRSFTTGAQGVDYEAKMAHEFTSIEACRVPVIAAISGACTGGGAAIAACCDIRVATADMKYGFPIARTLGNCLSAASLSKLVSIVGAPRIADMLLTTRLIESPEALASGLVTYVLPDHASMMAHAMMLATRITEQAPLTMNITKELLRRLRTEGSGLDDRDQVARAYGSADFREGLDAFLTKRKPHWTGT
jgi:enoyl-CoA hydratase